MKKVFLLIPFMFLLNTAYADVGPEHRKYLQCIQKNILLIPNGIKLNEAAYYASALCQKEWFALAEEACKRYDSKSNISDCIYGQFFNQEGKLHIMRDITSMELQSLLGHK